MLKNETFKAEVIGRTPMRRVGQVSEVAATVANLAMPGGTLPFAAAAHLITLAARVLIA